MESLLVWLIIGAAAAWCLRSLFRTLTGKKTGCDCTGCHADCRPDAPCHVQNGAAAQEPTSNDSTNPTSDGR